MWKYVIIGVVGVAIGAGIIYVAKGLLEAMDEQQNAKEAQSAS
jgi:hypothetical protein